MKYQFLRKLSILLISGCLLCPGGCGAQSGTEDTAPAAATVSAASESDTQTALSDVPRGKVTIQQGGMPAGASGPAVSEPAAAQPTADVPTATLSWESAADAVSHMKIGWNLGNSFDATGDWIVQYTSGSNADFETAWGNPVTPDTLMHKLKENGIQAVRIPITWHYHFDEAGSIDPVWMSRVREVVDQAMAEDLYCIINIHHDTGADGWLKATPANYQKNAAVFQRLWEQIATEFRDYPELLLFEGFNEMLNDANEWTNPNSSDTDAVNSYNQLFVDTVRATGGNNAARNLVCCTYAAAHSQKALSGFSMPADRVSGHLIAEVHFYSPYEFITDEGVTWTSPISSYNDHVENTVDTVFGELKDYFGSRSIPLIIGEFAADDKQNTQDRIQWYTRVVTDSMQIGAACFLWDNGNGYNMGHLDRTGSNDSFPEIVAACVEAAN
ncbi:MAG: glycoside hydrolase family 5 protein [Lachnospiraceae bacterium]|nr:glycoside hydrolase family 5 protein [Lachnospiraceae bacterium]